ncbi:unnamed protein product [Microthlaspi erraticum]|uniref:SEC1 family transport protein SLY1 n=1 Tax=Microthlaspi erraticum TaxID=1685480 RepID=A0A6D2L7C2_9BRAS|nr:unnamed protein product [Microthlaspi erraticum]
MLNLNQPLDPSEEEDFFKVLICDDFCNNIIAPLMQAKDLLRHGVTLTMPIFNPNPKNQRGRVPAPAVYFVQPTETNIQRIISDVSTSLYDTFHLNFSSSIPRPLLEALASGTLNSIERVAKVYDQYLEFATLEDNLFSLEQHSVYDQLNDPSATDREIEEVIEKVADGLFCVLATLCVVPVIQCPRGGPAEMVASSLDHKLRDHLLSSKNNLFTQGGGVSSFQRPLLCILDRSFDLSVGIQHDFRYNSLVHDVLGLKLNGLKLPGGDKKTIVDISDQFWSANGSLGFPEVAVEIANQLNKYKKEVEEINMRTGGGRRSSNSEELDGNVNTKHLMNAVKSLPVLQERKKVIDKHTNIATLLLGEIKERSLDVYTEKENDMIKMRGSVDMSDLLSVLKGKGTKMDKIRFALMYLISLETINQVDVEAVEAALREAEADTSAFRYVKKIKSLNVSLAASSDNSAASRRNIVDWAEKLYGQSISAVTAGVKNLLTGDQEPAVVRTVEALMEGKQNAETDSYLVMDPRASKSVSSGSLVKGPFREAIVFMVGGGNYIEYNSLQELSQRQETVKNVIYGATEMLTGAELVEQLAFLGQNMGLR